MNSFSCVIVFYSIHKVLAVEKILKKEKIIHDVIPVPREINSDCGMAVAIKSDDVQRVKELIVLHNQEIEGLYIMQEGRYKKYE